MDSDNRTEQAHHHVVKLGKHKSIKLQTVTFIFTVIAFLIATALYITDSQVTHGYLRMEQATERYIKAQDTATTLKIGSDYLTDRVRSFVVTGDIRYLQDYYEEVEVTKSRDNAVEDLEILLEGRRDDQAYQHLAKALEWSNALINQEKQAMHYAVQTGEYDESQIPRELLDMECAGEEKGMSEEELKRAALDLVLGEEYIQYKEEIMNNISQCTDDLIEESNLEVQKASKRMEGLLTLQTILTILLIVFVIAFVIFISRYIRKPLSHMVEMMKAKKTVPPAGVEEIRFVTETYNEIFEENLRTHQSLLYDAMHDRLTGLFNRRAYEVLPKDIDMDHAGLLVIDIDKFKEVNDTYGHDVGDQVLKRVAETLKASFRSVDYIFRIGGDEFVVIMTRVDSSKQDLVVDKIQVINRKLSQPQKEQANVRVSISAGVAFSDRDNAQGDLFKDADTALYKMKSAGRCGCVVY